MLSCSDVLKGLSHLNNGDKSSQPCELDWPLFERPSVEVLQMNTWSWNTHTDADQSSGNLTPHMTNVPGNYDDVRSVFKGLASVFLYCSFTDRKCPCIRITSRIKPIVSVWCWSRSEQIWPTFSATRTPAEQRQLSARHSSSCSRARMDWSDQSRWQGGNTVKSSGVVGNASADPIKRLHTHQITAVSFKRTDV